MKKSVIFFILLFCTVLNAQSDVDMKVEKNKIDETVINKTGNGSSLSFYKPLYILFGNNDDQVKGQISFKYDPFYESIDNLGLYITYTQIMHWMLYEFSSPFEDTNFNPEILWIIESKKNIFRNFDLKKLDFIKLGLIEHKSNGKDGPVSRSFNRSYIEVQSSIGQVYNFGINIKYFYIYNQFLATENIDIQEYIGSWETKVFLKHDTNFSIFDFGEIYFKFGAGGGMNGFNFRKGWQEFGIIFPTIKSRLRPYLQIFHGYGEFMLDYNIKKDNVSVRIGFVME